MSAGDALAARFADDFVPSDELPALADDLGRCESVSDIGAAIAQRSGDAPAGFFAMAVPWINACFAHDRVEDILAALSQRSEPDAQKALAAMNRHCPKSLKVALRALREARKNGQLEACLQMEYRISLACIAAPDMVEGIRAVVIDKDQKPRWSPSALADVTGDMVASYFAARPGDEINFV